MITAVSQNSAVERGKGKKEGGDRKGRQSINSEQSVKETDFLIHFSSSVCGLCCEQAGLCVCAAHGWNQRWVMDEISENFPEREDKGESDR